MFHICFKFSEYTNISVAVGCVRPRSSLDVDLRPITADESLLREYEGSPDVCRLSVVVLVEAAD